MDEKISAKDSHTFISAIILHFWIFPGLWIMIPGEFNPLAKKELLKIPVFGWIAKSASIIVDRSSGESRKKSMDKLKKLLTGVSILFLLKEHKIEQGTLATI